MGLTRSACSFVVFFKDFLLFYQSFLATGLNRLTRNINIHTQLDYLSPMDLTHSSCSFAVFFKDFLLSPHSG